MTIEELLNSMISDPKDPKTLHNTKTTWSRIGSKDSFLELSLSTSEKDEFLSEWIEANPYSDAK